MASYGPEAVIKMRGSEERVARSDGWWRRLRSRQTLRTFATFDRRFSPPFAYVAPDQACSLFPTRICLSLPLLFFSCLVSSRLVSRVPSRLPPLVSSRFALLASSRFPATTAPRSSSLALPPSSPPYSSSSSSSSSSSRFSSHSRSCVVQRRHFSRSAVIVRVFAGPPINRLVRAKPRTVAADAETRGFLASRARHRRSRSPSLTKPSSSFVSFVSPLVLRSRQIADRNGSR